MSNHTSKDKQFIKNLTDVISVHLEDENFGVSELAAELGMSRATLHRKLKFTINKSPGRIINEVRLQKALEMLKERSGNVSEIADKVGFGSAAYFNKCFHDFYGFPPGDILKGKLPVNDKGANENQNADSKKFKKIQLPKIYIVLFIIVIISGVFLRIYNNKRLSNMEKSVAVLPFNNLSNDDEYQYFADGIMESILNLLNQIGEFSVAPYASVGQFRGTTKTAAEIAKILDVNYILDGSIQKDGDKLRIIVRFVDVKKDKQIMSVKFDEESTDIFEIQSKIAKEVANKLQMTLTPKEMDIVEKIPTNNTEAYYLYLKGRFFWNKRTEDGIKESINLFSEAVEVDPDFALAWSGMADAYYILSGYGWYTPKTEGEAKAKICAVKALDIDNSIAEAHTTLGFILGYTEWEWEEAENELVNAIRLNPNYAFAHQIYSQLSDIKGNYRKAREEIDIAHQLAPLTPIIHYISATLYYNEGDYVSSLKECQEILSLESNFPQISWWLFKNYYRLGQGNKALYELQKILHMDSLTENYTKQAEEIYAQSGLDGLIEWLTEITNEIKLTNQENETNLYWEGYLSEIYAISGQKEKALELIENYLESNAKGDRLVRLINNRDYETLFNEPRFKEVVNKLGLMEYYKNTLPQFIY